MTTTEGAKAAPPNLSVGHSCMKKIQLMAAYAMAMDDDVNPTHELLELIAERCIDYCYASFMTRQAVESHREVAEVLAPKLKKLRKELDDDNDVEEY